MHCAQWMELGSLPMHFDAHPGMRELLGPGRALHFHATDTSPEVGAEWVVDLTGDALAWRRAHEKAAVAVRGPLTDLLLLLYKRRSADSGAVEILGDRPSWTSGWSGSASLSRSVSHNGPL